MFFCVFCTIGEGPLSLLRSQLPRGGAYNLPPPGRRWLRLDADGGGNVGTRNPSQSADKPEPRSGFVALTYSVCGYKRGHKSLTIVAMRPRRPAGRQFAARSNHYSLITNRYVRGAQNTLIYFTLSVSVIIRRLVRGSFIAR